MATPPDEINRLREELKRLQQQLAELRQRELEGTREAGAAELAERRRREEMGLEKPMRREGETRGQYIARLRRFYAQQRRVQQRAERIALRQQAAEPFLIREENLPPLPTAPEPGESQEQFARRQRAVMEERDRIISEARARALAAARSVKTSELSEAEVEAMRSRTRESLRSSAIATAAQLLRLKAHADKIVVPYMPDPGESELHFQQRVTNATILRDTDLLDYESRLRGFRNDLQRLAPEELELERLRESGWTPEQISAYVETLPAGARKNIEAYRRMREYAQTVIQAVEFPEEYGLTPDGRYVRNVAMQGLEEAAVASLPALPSITKLIMGYNDAKKRAVSILDKANQMLRDVTSQIEQNIAFKFLVAVHKLPQDFNNTMIPQVPAEELIRQAQAYLMRRGGFIGIMDFTRYISARVVDAGPPPVIEPPLPPDPQEIIDVAADQLAQDYMRAQREMDSAKDQIISLYAQGAVTEAQLPEVVRWQTENGITLPQLPSTFGTPEAMFASNPRVKELIERIKTLRSSDSQVDRRALIQLVSSLYAATVNVLPEVPENAEEMTPGELERYAERVREAKNRADMARYILEETGMI